MKRIFGKAGALILGACLAAAVHPVAEAAETAGTRAGPARIVAGPTMARMFVGAAETRFDFEPRYADIESKLGDLLLVRLASGGNGCPAMFAWVRATPGQLKVTASFGACSDLAEISHDSETVTVSMPSMKPGEGRAAFVYDGRVVTKRVLGLQPSGAPPAAGAERWIGRQPFELVKAAEWRSRFEALMGAATFLDAQRIINVSSPVRRDGRWVTGFGCQPHACNSAVGAVAIEIGGDGVVVALWERAPRPDSMASRARPYRPI